jgi:hypothetical protein
VVGGYMEKRPNQLSGTLGDTRRGFPQTLPQTARDLRLPAASRLRFDFGGGAERGFHFRHGFPRQAPFDFAQGLRRELRPEFSGLREAVPFRKPLRRSARQD